MSARKVAQVTTPPQGGTATPAVQVTNETSAGGCTQPVYIVSQAEVNNGTFKVAAGGRPLHVVIVTSGPVCGGKPLPIFLVTG